MRRIYYVRRHDYGHDKCKEGEDIVHHGLAVGLQVLVGGHYQRKHFGRLGVAQAGAVEIGVVEAFVYATCGSHNVAG